MIGQNKLLSKLNKLEFDDFPSSLILLGKLGCGKHTLCKEIHNKYVGYDMNYVHDKINYNFVESCYLSVIPTFYIIDAVNLSAREQNAILKLFEEPPQNSKIIILTTNLNGLLNTIINRAVVWEFEKYSDEELSQFMIDDDKLILKYARTPGQVKTMSSDKLHQMINLAQLMIDKINRAYIANVLSISDRFNFKELTEDKFDVSIFMDILKYVVVDNIKTNPSDKLIQIYCITNEYINALSIQNLNKKYSFEKFLLDFKEIMS